VRTFTSVVLLTGLLSLGCLAQQQSNINIDRMGGPGPREQGEKKSEPPISPQDRKRAMALLDSVEGPVRGMDGATQAQALIQIAKAYSTTDKKKALSLLDDAMSAIRGAQLQFTNERMKTRTRDRIQRSIVQAMLPLDESHVEKLMTEVEPELQQAILGQLLQYYTDRKEDDKAIAAIEQIARTNEMPYGQAAVVMGRMGPEQSAEQRSLFTEAMNSYDLHDDPGQMKSGGFPDLIMQFHSKLPPELVRQAADLVLAHAKKGDDKAIEDGVGKPSIGIGSSKGAVQFSSLYDFALFQLEPAIREADPQYADALLKEHRDAQLFLTKYPGGLAGLRGNESDPNSMGMMMSMSGGAPPKGGGGGGGGRSGPGGPGGQGGPSPLDMQRQEKIREDAESHPQDAMAAVPTLSSPEMQVQSYLGIASASSKKNSSVAHSALNKAMELNSKLQPEEQVRTAIDAASIYRRMEDTEAAKNALEKAVDLGDQILKQDTNAEDPNQAPRWYWPSTAAWRSSMEVATKLDSRWAMSLLKGITDEDIRALNQLAIASELLHIAPRMTETMTIHKDGARMMVTDSHDN
jgi:tetratricopeptide (TPR) repeat protein